MRGYLSDSQRKNFGTPIVREVIIKANNDARYDVLHKIRCPAAERAKKEWRRGCGVLSGAPPYLYERREKKQAARGRILGHRH
jgi:hypothetical protein